MAYQPTEKQLSTHKKWVKWFENINTHIKHNVKLYQLKNIYEKHLQNPRVCHEQEAFGENTLKADMILTFIYEYDGGVIGAGGHYHIIEDTMCLGEDTDSKEESLRKEKELFAKFDEIISQKGGIRVGIYNQRTSFQPSFHLISSYEEDQKYYVEDHIPYFYDDTTPMLYYGIRYGISIETYYVLSGMSEWSDDIFDEIVAPPCPKDNDEILEREFYTNYLEGVDLISIYEEMDNTDISTWKEKTIFQSKYGLTVRIFEFLKEPSNRL